MSNLVSPANLKPGRIIRLVKNKHFFLAQEEAETVCVSENEILFIVSKKINLKLGKKSNEILFLAPCGLIYDIYPLFLIVSFVSFVK
jgi:hypothetical protein